MATHNLVRRAFVGLCILGVMNVANAQEEYTYVLLESAKEHCAIAASEGWKINWDMYPGQWGRAQEDCLNDSPFEGNHRWPHVEAAEVEQCDPRYPGRGKLGPGCFECVRMGPMARQPGEIIVGRYRAWEDGGAVAHACLPKAD